jgi:hypothetical protein
MLESQAILADKDRLHNLELAPEQEVLSASAVGHEAIKLAGARVRKS